MTNPITTDDFSIDATTGDEPAPVALPLNVVVKMAGDAHLNIHISDEGVVIDAYRAGGTTLVGTSCQMFEELFEGLALNA